MFLLLTFYNNPSYVAMVTVFLCSHRPRGPFSEIIESTLIIDYTFSELLGYICSPNSGFMLLRQKLGSFSQNWVKNWYPVYLEKRQKEPRLFFTDIFNYSTT
ncbi:hypothetical protein XENOCAPTIV_010559 [Xenoophorus captivus]|uniref:Maturase K n=1 Tax=Xenoophorus captivus TaxID=1517983 RepID=A0ABV0RQH9_9TELE